MDLHTVIDSSPCKMFVRRKKQYPKNVAVHPGLTPREPKAEELISYRFSVKSTLRQMHCIASHIVVHCSLVLL